MKVRLLFLIVFSFLTGIGFTQITSVGLVGEFNGWGTDPDIMLTQDAQNPDVWTVTTTLPDGPLKFRANSDWAINWGTDAFPAGTGTQDGPNIPVWAGDYFITFNSATGEYYFDVDSPIGIIGDATPGGWDDDTDMYKMQDNEHGFFIEVFLTQGSAKFRKDDDWAVNWGSADFPSGIGVQDGANIPIDQAGEYRITLDTLTGEYNFTEIITFEFISLIGSATPGGWDSDTDLTQNGADPDLWRANIELTDGVAKFRANHDWAINWGALDFPSGVGVQDGPDIPVVAGLYQVDFNTATGEYSFLPITYYATIGIIGDATPGGWVDDTDMEVDPTDPAKWTVRMVFTDGEAKFRADNDWAVNWGAGDFPTGIGEQDGANIPVPAGEYRVDFCTTSGVYNFTEIIVFNTIGLVGTATPLASWDVDVDMAKDPADEHHWTIASIDLTTGNAKFRAEDAWTVNWGATDWPSGVGTQDGPDIPITGGTYGVTLYSNSGEYAFGNPFSSTQDLLDPKAITLFPNPVENVLTIDLNEIEWKGDIHVTILDNAGRTLMNQRFTQTDALRINTSDIPAGNYILRLSGDAALVGKYFSIVK